MLQFVLSAATNTKNTQTSKTMTETPISQDPSNEVSEADQEFVKCLEEEAERLQAAVESGISPMEAQAKALVWLDALVKIHAVGLDNSLSANDASQSAVWSRDLTGLEMSLALLQNVTPLKQPVEG